MAFCSARARTSIPRSTETMAPSAPRRSPRGSPPTSSTRSTASTPATPSATARRTISNCASPAAASSATYHSSASAADPRTRVCGWGPRRTTRPPTAQSPRDLRMKSMSPVFPMVSRAASRTSWNMILDNLPVAVTRQRRDGSQTPSYERGFRVGYKNKDGKYYINNHLSFYVLYHKDLESEDAHIVGFEVIPSSLNRPTPKPSPASASSSRALD